MSGWIPSFETLAKGTVATAAALASVSGGLIYYGQNYLIYPSAYMELGPGSLDCDTPDEYGVAWEDLELKTPDGETLRCYLLPQKRSLPTPTKYTNVIRIREVEQRNASSSDDEFMSKRPTVIMFHGNAGTVGHRIPLGMIFQLQMRCNVVMVSYRGYGKSTGKPSEKGLKIDAQTALDYVLSDNRLAKTPIVLYGQSIGGAVSIALASSPANSKHIHSMILENTFTSLPDLIPHVLPALNSVRWLCHEKWDSAGQAANIPKNVHILMLSGLMDEIVPKEQMATLKGLLEARGGEVVWRDFPKGTHNSTTAEKGYWEAVAGFLSAYVEKSKKR